MFKFMNTALSNFENIYCVASKNVTYPIAVRLCHVQNKKQCVTEDKHEDLNPATISRFSEILKLPKNEVIHILKSNSDIRKITGCNLSSRLSFLSERNITNDMVCRHPWLLIENKRLMDMKLELIKRNTKTNLPEAMCLLKLSIPRLRQFLDRNKINEAENQEIERIDYLADKLHCDKTRACELLNKHKFLLTISFEKIEATMALLEKTGVSGEDILKDPYILCYSPESIEPRIREAQIIGMTKIKPWLIRSKQDVFYRSLQRYKDIKDQLGDDPSIVEFLLRRLKLKSADQVTELFRIQPRLLHSSARKLGTAITTLELQGYTCEQIAKCPRALTASIRTIIRRLEVLRELESKELPALSVLAFSSKKFSTHYNRIKTYRALLRGGN